MSFLVSAKSGAITNWRAVQDFAAAYQQALLERAASDVNVNPETVFAETYAELEAAISTHKDLQQHLESLLDEAAATSAATELKVLTVNFFDDLYRHFSQFRSAPAFYQLSTAFLRRISATIIRMATDQLEAEGGSLPRMALIAVGPAGRCEYSPCCQLQMLLVHEETTPPQLRTLDLFCQALHGGFEAAGLAIDPAVSPRNPRWRGAPAEWRERCEEALHPQLDEELIDLYRLVDQCPLHGAEDLALELKRTSGHVLAGNHAAVTTLIARMASLSNGLGIMGRLKLERRGSSHGLFRLLDHGLLPLSAALSALALIKDSPAADNCDRIRDLLRKRELDVDLAERMLATWHFLNNLRLWQEKTAPTEIHAVQPLLIDPNDLTTEQRHSLKEALESVAAIQRHVEITFSGMGE